MPKIKNKVTGVEQNVTDEQMTVIKANPLTKELYDYYQTQEPEEVKNLKAAKAKETPGTTA